MRYLHGTVKANNEQAIRVHFDQPTRVLFLDDKNYNKYKDGLSFTYYGGHKEDSPVDFKVPYGGKWHVIVEKGWFNPKDISSSIELVRLNGFANHN
jgi:hypothetical protein